MSLCCHSCFYSFYLDPSGKGGSIEFVVLWFCLFVCLSVCLIVRFPRIDLWCLSTDWAQTWWDVSFYLNNGPPWKPDRLDYYSSFGELFFGFATLYSYCLLPEGSLDHPVDLVFIDFFLKFQNIMPRQMLPILSVIFTLTFDLSEGQVDNLGSWSSGSDGCLEDCGDHGVCTSQPGGSSSCQCDVGYDYVIYQGCVMMADTSNTSVTDSASSSADNCK